jgi:hemoglobin
MRSQRESIFHRVGGFAAVSGVVSDFYAETLADDLLAPYFAGIDMARQIDHQTKFVASLMGGPASFTDEHLGRVHARLKITPAAFNRMITVFRETLEDHGLDETDIGLIIGEMNARRHFVVSETG